MVMEVVVVERVVAEGGQAAGGEEGVTVGQVDEVRQVRGQLSGQPCLHLYSQCWSG